MGRGSTNTRTNTNSYKTPTLYRVPPIVSSQENSSKKKTPSKENPSKENSKEEKNNSYTTGLASGIAIGLATMFGHNFLSNKKNCTEEQEKLLKCLDTHNNENDNDVEKCEQFIHALKKCRTNSN